MREAEIRWWFGRMNRQRQIGFVLALIGCAAVGLGVGAIVATL